MKTKFALWIVGLSLLGAVPVFATGTSLNFNKPNTLSGDTATYTFDSHTITATGYQCTDNTLNSCSTDGVSLATKSGGLGEMGLGIAGGSHGDNEIEAENFIQLDFSQFASLGITSLTFQIESVQNGEGFRLFESNTSGMPGASPVFTATGNGTNNPNSILTETVSVNFAQNAYLDFSALKSGGGDNDVLLGTMSTPSSGGPGPTPEPGTLVLFGTGMLVVGGVMRRYLPRSA